MAWDMAYMILYGLSMSTAPHLSSSYLPDSELLLFCRYLHQPGQEGAVIDQRLPLGLVPVHVLEKM